MTNEQPFVHQALERRGIDLTTMCLLGGFEGSLAVLENIFTGVKSERPFASIVIIGHRQPRDRLYRELADERRRGA